MVSIQRWYSVFLLLFMTGPGFSQTAENHIVSNVPGNFQAGFHINDFLGADRFYNAGFTGQGTITANVEAGHIWSGHESLQHVTQFVQHADTFGNTVDDLFDRHATWVGQHIGGRQTAVNGGAWQTGIAPGTDLRSGAIATQWNGSAYATSFNLNGNTLDGAYRPFFGTADVINSSWGGTDATGTGVLAQRLDGFSAQNSQTTFVTSAGNSGPGANTIGSPGSGYNSITVAALANGGNNSYNQVASFSSRGPQSYGDPVNGTITGVRAAIDIAAPGTNLHGAFYGGQSGGNNPTLPGSANSGGPNSYSTSIQGTSFASPIVAGGVSLLKSASYNTPAIAADLESRHTLVVKSVLMNSADKTLGWSNGQTAHVNGLGGVSTSQSLDWNVGAGRMNLDRAFDQLLTGTLGVAGLSSGNLGLVSQIGWDLGRVVLGQTNSYIFGDNLEANSLLNVTLNWFRNRTYNPDTFIAVDVGQANLNLRIVDDITNVIISESNSLFNVSEHLSFLVPYSSRFRIEVNYAANTFGAMGNVDYGLAWSGTFTAIPEPTTLLLVSVSAVLLGASRRIRGVKVRCWRTSNKP